MRFGFEKSGDTGRIFESRVFGSYEITPEFVEKEKALPRDRRGRYRDDEDIYRLVKEMYRGDPAEPESAIAKDLRIAVADALGLSGDEEENLSFYTAVGTPIDHRMGVDGFFEYKDPKTGHRARATVDVTLRKSKVSGEDAAKADVVIGELPDAVDPDEADDYLDAIDEYGRRIAERLRPKREEKRKAA